MISVEHIKKRFGDTDVLRGVTLSVKAGEIYGLIGHNGAGKTTLMTIMAGLLRADSGTCTLSEKGIGYLPDVPGFFDYLTCGEYLDFLLSGLSTPAKRTRSELLRMVDLSEKTRVGALSRGMRQRLGIGAVLVNDPDVLLLDEPTSALDPSGRMEVLEILRSLRAEGKAILLSTHILADMETVCDAVGFLHNGVITRQLRVAELQSECAWIVRFRNAVSLESPSDAFALRQIDDNTWLLSMRSDDVARGQQEALRYLAALGQQIESIHNDTQNLNAIFQEVCRA